MTGVVSVVAPGSLVQIMAGSTISLIFFGMHARCWPYKDEANNRLKLGCEFALVVSFSCAALLRSVATKQALVDAGHLQPEAMTSQEKIMPAGGYAARGQCTPRGVQHSCLRECQLTPLERVSPNSASSVEHPVLSTILVVVCTCLPAGILIYNHKFAKHDVDEAVVNDIDDSGEFENPVADESPRGSQQLALNQFKNPVADESQESHSPSPSCCLCNAVALCCRLAAQIHVDSATRRGT